MAKTYTTTTDTKDKPNTKPVCCLDCKHSALHRYGTNPILSACHAQPQPGNERFPYKVEVASFIRICALWKQSTEEKTVEQRRKAV